MGVVSALEGEKKSLNIAMFRILMILMLLLHNKRMPLTGELEGIIYGLELSVNYFTHSKQKQESEMLYIICDCSQAIEVCVKRASVIMRPELVSKLLFLEDRLSEMKVNITIAWIPGHQGIQFNDIADRLTKDTARDIYTGRVAAPSFITYDAIKIAGEISAKSWQKSGIKTFLYKKFNS